MVCGCSWSMKIAERSSAMVSAHQLPQLVEDHRAQVVAGQLAAARGRGGDRRRLGPHRPRLQAVEVAERLVAVA